MRTTLARLESNCSNCDQPITVGATIRRLNGVGFIHAACPVSSVLTSRCGGCTTTVGHACLIRTRPGERCALHADQPIAARRIRLAR